MIHRHKTKLSLHYLLLFCLGSSASGHASSRQDIQQLRTLSYSVLENVLVFHNPMGSPFDSSNSDTYRRDLQQLRQSAATLGLVEIATQADQLDAAVADLQPAAVARRTHRRAIQRLAQRAQATLTVSHAIGKNLKHLTQMLAVLGHEQLRLPCGDVIGRIHRLDRQRMLAHLAIIQATHPLAQR